MNLQKRRLLKELQRLLKMLPQLYYLDGNDADDDDKKKQLNSNNMFTSDFNPFEILNNNEVQKNLNEVVNKVKKKGSPNIGGTVTRYAMMNLAHFSTFLINTLGKINQWQNKKEINKFHIAQLNYLLKHPDDLKKVVEANLVVCAIIHYHSYSIAQLSGNVTDTFNTLWCAIKNLSFDKGFKESQKDIEKRKERNMWIILLSPVALLMNHKYLIGEDKSQCELLLADIIEEGNRHSDVDSLCTEAVFNSFMDNSILNYLKKDKDRYKKYIDIQSKEDFCDIIDSHIDFFLKYIEDPERINL